MPKRARAKAKARAKRAGQQRPSQGGMESQVVVPLPTMRTSSTSFVRSTAPVLLTKSASDPSSLVSFAFADLPGYTDFTSLFDYYRLRRVDMKFTGIFNALVTSKLYVTSDFDGGAVLSLAQMAEHRHVERIISQDHPEFTFSVVPRLAASLLTSTGTVASGVTNSWVDLATPTVVHYGIQYVVLNYNTGAGGLNLYTSFVYHFDVSGVR